MFAVLKESSVEVARWWDGLALRKGCSFVVGEEGRNYGAG